MARLLAMKFYKHGLLKYPYVMKFTTEEILPFLEQGPNLELILEDSIIFIDQADRRMCSLLLFFVTWFANFVFY